ncbi:MULTISPECIES: R2-like ligand-binding oxidase [unclassified Peribacillus]|uniref:R2-like ligand-binding oxidase n=1 Tax=unclassified Peribacillus TaxID=2675266 RepID=UPI001913FA60|nr:MULTISPECIES: R2-like ligand-binding oxidase [unclassified Peribacillus]MBK5441922.1 R2-like ligand-binding oxidase [Peribacillus sp. TH24]MBK5463300.1 R2-like ligand-binding oxidase [Peribacillus sp. TH27]
MKRTNLTTSSRSFREDTLPFKLYQKAKKFGVWNPRDINFSQDIEDWKSFTSIEREVLLRIISLFQGGEGAVTLDLLPLIMAIAKEGRIEEEMYLTTFLFEEAKHMEFFRYTLDQIGETGDLTVYHSETYKSIFYEILPEAMEKLIHDQSPEALAEAATVYNMFTEGVLAETGYFGFYQTLENNNMMPGLLKGVGLLKKDESRHIAYGTFLLQRIISEHPHIFRQVEKRMAELAPLAIALNMEGYDRFGNPFDNDKQAVLDFTMKQLAVRMEVLARAKGKKIEEIYQSNEKEYGVL